ncbi:response regulator [Chloroflexi bacterium TSY]|nr:response regulator [Chloroflexi bacterium TSY]
MAPKSLLSRLKIVKNAKFGSTETGSIVVKATRQGHEVCISVRDTGPGIPPQELARIFEPFVQVEQVRLEQGSSGLGLSICKLFIDRHQGRIWAESELNSSSTFSFTLPITPRESSLNSRAFRVGEDWVWQERAAWPNVPEIPRNQRIMICDQQGDLHPMLTRYTDDIAFSTARDLATATQTLAQHPAHMLILNTPNSDVLISLLAQARRTLPDIPIIGCAFPSKTNYALDAGATDHLIKPVRESDLAQALQALGRPVKRILVVDDHPDMQHLFGLMLGNIDPIFELTTATNGAEALAKLQQQVKHHQAPDVVLLDILLPDMLGWQLLAEKNQDEMLRDIPVIVVSGEPLVDWPTHSPFVMATLGDGVSITKLLQGARQLAHWLMMPDSTLDPMPE